MVLLHQTSKATDLGYELERTYNFTTKSAAYEWLYRGGYFNSHSKVGWTQDKAIKGLVFNKFIEFSQDKIETPVTPKTKLTGEITSDLKLLEVIDQMVEHHVAKRVAPKEVVVTYKERKTTIQGRQHRDFEEVLTILSTGLNLMLVGASGSGKTSVAMRAAKAIGLDFYSLSVGLQTSKVEFLGYMDANGKYVKTLFRKAYESGGVFLIDEIDAGNAGVLTIVNAALANEVTSFPDKMVEKHKDFICVAAANTWGQGADRMYVGRNQLDAATLNRFVKHNFDYDEEMEMEVATCKEWCSIVQKFRKVAFDGKMRILVTPRASFDGSKLAHAGMNFLKVAELTIFNGISNDEKRVLLNGTGLDESKLSKINVNSKN